MKDFETLENLLYSNSDNRIIPGLERISRLLERMGNPQNSFKSVHIVGTNGKGSTGSFISSVLKASGYKTGFYSSPHLVSPAERFLVDGEELPADFWVDAVNEAVRHIAEGEDLPSYFELLTAGAFEIARRERIEAGVIEAGLGGKLDATNTMNNTACTVIASISIDHTEYLGPTLEGIAGEKFAVVRENVPAVFSGVDESLAEMFREICREKGALPFIVSEEARVENVKVTAEGNIIDFYAPNLELKRLRTGLIGDYQVRNAALALSALSLMRESFPKITESSIREGM
ncbi:MAG: bifunctional folylpolyglutamate synthase/dihydrofolate synthase, partial [Synergistaceae bacterium]|nr:bifunctional folylpolyglutamate synthase/dihydrofolate synthase [Synergistaceae bacterium]